MWVKHHSFLEAVSNNWSILIDAYGILKLQLKLLRLKKFLKQWNWNIFGNIFDGVKAAQTGSELCESISMIILLTLPKSPLKKQMRPLPKPCHLKKLIGNKKLPSDGFWKDPSDIKRSGVNFFSDLLSGEQADFSPDDLTWISPIPPSANLASISLNPSSVEIYHAIAPEIHAKAYKEG
ncbi:hypothetical protein BUALT_Bualt19G0002300 [Buddleja alternifolia]|uniref:Uncharacterized protein n=1 Tax=Buddleja alternifolia TaxID=168488 RepID=A0AAV6W4L0_9LAMI|nr:hypothetical protein BUALT_Bualt19G0002300 [Buddleja alternifolia]